MNAISPIGRNEVGISGALTLDDLRAKVPSVFATHAHDSRSTKYTFLPTVDAIEALMAEGFTVAAAKQSRSRLESRRGFTRHLVRLRAPGLGNAEYAPEVILTNAHDGGGSFKALGGAFRFFCFNGLIVADGRIEAVVIPHRGKVLEMVVEGVMRVMGHARELGAVFDQWRDTELTQQDQENFAYRAHMLRPTGADFMKLLGCRRDADSGTDLWHVFNRVQENLMVGGLDYTHTGRDANGAQRIRHLATRPIRGVDQDVALNRGLWALAEEYAQVA